MTGPSLGMGMPADDGWVSRRFDDMQRQLNELRAARTLEAATIGRGGLTIDGGTLTIENGTLVVNGSGIAESGNYVPGSAGWALQPDGNAEFNTLTLRTGIIGDDALTSPVSPAIYNGDVSGQNASAAYVTLVNGSIAVPAGFSQALVMAVISAGCSTNASGGTFITLSCVIAGVSGSTVSAWVPTGAANSATASNAQLVTGLNGGSVSVQAEALETSPANVTAGTVNGHISAVALFLR